MTCECGCTKWDTFDTRPRETYIWRRKKCLYCGAKVSTREMIYLDNPTTVEVGVKEYTTLKQFRDGMLTLVSEAMRGDEG